MKGLYYTLAGAAIVASGCLLGLQILGGIEYTAGATTYTTASMIAAMITVAVLPVFIHLAAHISKGIAAVLVIGFIGFLAYSVPANLGRIGELKEVKALGATDAAALQVELASLSQTLAYARPDMETECHGAPYPLPPKGWPECRRKRGTVTAVEAEYAKKAEELRKQGSARVGDVGSTTLAWASAGLLTAETIRKGSGLGIVLGLETVIWGLVWLATIAIQKGMGPMVHVPAVRQAITERDFKQEPLTPSELEELRQILLQKKTEGVLSLNNNDLAKAVGISPGECTKRVKDAVAAGILHKQRAGREVAITLH
jgi:hypothetical protein